MSSRLMAILEFDTARLCEWLQLPEEVEITDVWLEPNTRGRLSLKIEGAGWPTREGEHIQRTTGVVWQQLLPDGRELKPEFKWQFHNPAEFSLPAEIT